MKISRRSKQAMRKKRNLIGHIWEVVRCRGLKEDKQFMKLFGNRISKHTKRKINRGFLTPVQARRKDGDVVHVGRKLP